VRQKEKRLHRNFQGYPTDQAGTLIGFGTSAIGMLPQGYVQNAARTLAYREAILAGRPATARGLRLTAEDRLRREIIERLMCDLEVDLGVVARKHGRSLKHLAGAIARLGPLVEDGFVTLSGGVLSVAGHARPYLRHVCAAFDSYLTADETRFSRAF
jgi:oxygen-independent coproporphyrinogen-3 oxidase